MSVENLHHNIQLLQKQLFWLKHSYEKSKPITLDGDYTLDEFDTLETLCSRFSRSIDFLVRKVFRSIDDAEFEPQGTLIDTVNNAHKRNLFTDIEEIRTIKDIRNEIAHEYVEEHLKELFEEVLEYTPKLIAMMENSVGYVDKNY